MTFGRFAVAVVVSALGVGFPHPAASKTAEASFAVEVGAGTWQGVRVKNIPRGATLSLEVKSDGPVELLLLDAEDYRRFPAPDRPLFKGSTSDVLSVSLLAPRTSDYYVLVDNREGAGARDVAITVRGSTDDALGGSADAETRLREFGGQLGLLFEFEPFPIRVERCGKPAAFSDGDGVVLCEEYASHLHERLADPDKTRDALLFTLFHEIGHVLLRQWDYPTYANEETADEFATVVLMMLGQEERVRAQAEFFDANASFSELVSRAFSDDRHPLSAQRARNIRRWSEDPRLVQRWQPVFVPRMQTPALERLKQNPRPWTNVALVEQELQRRESAATR